LLEVGLPENASAVLERALEYCSTDEQRVCVLARQVDALQMAGQWKRSKEVLAVCRQIRKSATASNDQHDAFEIMLFDASYRTSLDVLALLPELTVCIECEDASPQHRIEAAVIALKIATDVDPFVLDAIYCHVEPLFAAASNDPARLEAEMVYHSIRGDGSRGIAAARALVEVARESKDPIRLARALGNAANSYRINGSVRDAETCLNEALDLSLKHHLMERAVIAMQQLVKLRLAVGEVSLARSILEQSKALPSASENLVTSVEQRMLEVRVALNEGNPSRAAKEFPLVPEVSVTCTPSRRGAYLALKARILVAEAASPDTLRGVVTELEKAHTQLWSMGCQDSEAESLFLGLNALGARPRAMDLLREYLSKYRRERRTPPEFLSKLLYGRGERTSAPEPRESIMTDSVI